MRTMRKITAPMAIWAMATWVPICCAMSSATFL